jgi:hypothetical protein
MIAKIYIFEYRDVFCPQLSSTRRFTGLLLLVTLKKVQQIHQKVS